MKKPPTKPKKKTQTVKQKDNQPFSLKRLIMGEEKPDLTELEAGSTTVLDILSPTTIDTKSRDYIVVDGVFHAYLYVAGYGYSTTVSSCWLAPLVEAGEGVNLSFIFKRQSKEKILSKIAQTTMVNRSPVFLDFFDDYKYTNGNCWIGGSSGAGKTFTLQCLGGRLRQQGKRVIFIVPKKGHEFRPLCELLGGLYLRLSPSSKDCPNVMAIRRRSLDSYSGLRDMTARDDSVLADKISRLIQGVLNLSEDEVRQITRFRRGEGLLCIGYNHVPIQFHATQKEYDAITTSPTCGPEGRRRQNERS